MVEHRINMVRTIFMAPCESLHKRVRTLVIIDQVKTTVTLLGTDDVVRIFSACLLDARNVAADSEFKTVRDYGRTVNRTADVG